MEQIKIKPYQIMLDEYNGLLKSGMFWEFYPELSGDWTKDKMAWKKIFRKNKELRKQAQDEKQNT